MEEVKEVNFVFVRHGQGCHNATSPLLKNSDLDDDSKQKLIKYLSMYDPELTYIGEKASIKNGSIVERFLNNIDKISDIGIRDIGIGIVGCSPLIRSMETAYFMTRKWKNPPKKIYVFPLLRELDESSSNIYSDASRERLKSIPSYAMRSIKYQKKYLETIGILDFFDFSFVETSNLRSEPGQITEFIKWFNYYKNEFNVINKRDPVNVFIVTHAGVLKNYAGEGYYNNSGFILNAELGKKITYRDFISMNDYLDKSIFSEFIKDYKSIKLNEYCPSKRCGKLCSLSK